MQETKAIAIAETKLATGASYRELAAQFATSPSAICRALNKEEIRDILETGMQQQIALIPKAIDTVRKRMDSDDETISLNASKIVLNNTGMAPQAGTNVYINNVYNDHRSEIPPIIEQLLKQMVSNDTVTIEGEVVDE